MQHYDQIEATNQIEVEVSTEPALGMIEKIKFDSNHGFLGESIVSLDVKSLYTFVLVKEAIDIALNHLYSQSEQLNLLRSTMNCLLYMAVCTVHFKCNDTWFLQKDGLTMGALLSANLAFFG